MCRLDFLQMVKCDIFKQSDFSFPMSHPHRHYLKLCLRTQRLECLYFQNIEHKNFEILDVSRWNTDYLTEGLVQYYLENRFLFWKIQLALYGLLSNESFHFIYIYWFLAICFICLIFLSINTHKRTHILHTDTDTYKFICIHVRYMPIRHTSLHTYLKIHTCAGIHIETHINIYT